MSYTSPLAERERALEEAFFLKENQRLLAQMRARRTRMEQREALARVLGLRNAKILDPLLDLGLREENVTALVMAPLVAVAWADRTLDARGRHFLLEAENELGIDPDSEAGKLLAIWLERRPHDRLIDAWSAYVSELCLVLSPGERTRLRNDIVRWSRRIADAIEHSGLRGGSPTRAERAVIDRIEEAFRTDGEVTTRDPFDGIDRVFSSMS